MEKTLHCGRKKRCGADITCKECLARRIFNEESQIKLNGLINENREYNFTIPQESPFYYVKG